MLTVLFCCVVGALLLFSAGAKLRDWVTFREIVRGYRLPGLAALAVAVPLLEVVLGLALLSLEPRLTAWGLGGALAFLGRASAAVARRRLRGEKRFRCGCGGDLSEEHPALALLARNGLLIILLAVALVFGENASPRVGERFPVYLTAGATAVGLKLLNALLRARRFRSEWKAFG